MEEQGLTNYLDSIILRNNETFARNLNGLGPDYNYSISSKKLDSRGHSSDIGKLPWHPTFSNESAYASKTNPGGVWNKEITSEGRIVNTFTPSIENMRNGNTVGLAKYFQEHEPEVVLKVPVPYNYNILK